ncbi:DUF6233 domain-containing protein [Streptomyces sp. MB09-01]|uniref:DUF6233 domain-containing protein n=1 Tax=Streptomyces sp. MB09-01 TaxID=3028666 RepID=UPI003A5C167F
MKRTRQRPTPGTAGARDPCGMAPPRSAPRSASPHHLAIRTAPEPVLAHDRHRSPDRHERRCHEQDPGSARRVFICPHQGKRLAWPRRHPHADPAYVMPVGWPPAARSTPEHDEGGPCGPRAVNNRWCREADSPVAATASEQTPFPGVPLWQTAAGGEVEPAEYGTWVTAEQLRPLPGVDLGRIPAHPRMRTSAPARGAWLLDGHVHGRHGTVHADGCPSATDRAHPPGTMQALDTLAPPGTTACTACDAADALLPILAHGQDDAPAPGPDPRSDGRGRGVVVTLVAASVAVPVQEQHRIAERGRGPPGG